MEGQDSSLRKTGFGSSDAALILRFARTGEISPALRRRVSVIKGDHEIIDVFSKYFDLGNTIEEAMMVYFENQSFTSNVFNNPTRHLQGKEFNNFDVLCHVDFEFTFSNNSSEDHSKWIELKSTKDDIDETLKKYSPQLAWHNMICSSYNDGTQVSLMVYDTSDIYDNPEQFDVIDENKISYHETKVTSDVGVLLKGLQDLDEIWETIEPYTEKEKIVLDATQVDAIPELRRIHELKKSITRLSYELSEMTAKLGLNMDDQEIKSVKVVDYLSISRTSAGQSSRLDTAKVKELYESKEFKKHFPNVVVPYKTSPRRASVTVKILNDE